MKYSVLGFALLWSVASGAAADRSYVSGNFILQLDGAPVGVVKSVDGGGAESEVITAPANAVYPFEKHIGAPKYGEFALQIDPTMGAALESWIDAALSMNFQRKNGEISSSAPSLSNQQFFNALITEIGFPACDAASKDPAYMTLKFAPEYVRYRKGSGTASLSLGAKKQKTFIPSNFRLEIDGLDCSKVSKVDSFAIKQSVTVDDIGDARDYQKEPGKLEFPNLKITLPESAVGTWFDWFEKFVLQGNNDENQEKDGRLVFLSPNLQEEICEVKFFNLGIFKLAPDKPEANSDGIKRVTIELYCELMEVNFKPSPAL